MSEQTSSTAESKDTTAKTSKDAAPDITGILERFKLPGFDLQGFVESRRHDIDALTQATTATFSGAQTIVDKQTELLKTVLAEVGDAMRAIPADAAKPAELLRKQQELASEALTGALSSMRDIAETVRKSQSEVLEIAANRVRSSVEEIRRLAKRPEAEETEAK